MFPLQILAWVPLSGASLLGERIREHLPGATSGMKAGGGIGFLCFDQGWKDLAVFSLCFVYMVLYAWQSLL